MSCHQLCITFNCLDRREGKQKLNVTRSGDESALGLRKYVNEVRAMQKCESQMEFSDDPTDLIHHRLLNAIRYHPINSVCVQTSFNLMSSPTEDFSHVIFNDRQTENLWETRKDFCLMLTSNWWLRLRFVFPLPSPHLHLQPSMPSYKLPSRKVPSIGNYTAIETQLLPNQAWSSHDSPRDLH